MTATQAPAGGNQIRIGDREARLRDVFGHAGRLQLGLTERTLFGIGAAMAVAGFICIIVAWIGTSRTILVAGQIPYLVSGGLIGLGLVFMGGFLYFGHWLAMMVKENRQRADADHEDALQLRESLDELNRTLTAAIGTGALRASPASGGALATSDGAAAMPAFTATVPAPALVATSTGSMMHRPTCAAVAGREGIHRVSVAEGLKPCGICRPLDPSSA